MTIAGEVTAEYPIPTANAGARSILALEDGRAFFSEYDAGQIGELVPVY
jgi:streptogramin lyase